MTTNTPEAALDEAQRLAATGIPCFPCRLPDKRPTCRHGFKDATADADKLRELWRRSPGDLVGVPTGEASALFVVDIDSPRHPGAGEWLEHNRARLPETQQHQTISGGLHIILKHPAGFGNTAGKLARGVDTRGDGGYIIWWPAHLGLGAQHKFVPAVPAPNWLIEALQPPTVVRFPIRTVPRAAFGLRPDDNKAAMRKLEGIVGTVGCAREGERNSLTYWGACRIHDMVDSGELVGGDIDFAFQALACAAGNALLPASEIRRAISSAASRQQA